MKVYRKQPTRELIILKTDSANEYELYVITPKLVGSVRKEGTQRIVTEDGQHFTNINSAARYLLEQTGDDLAKTLNPHMKKGPNKIEVTGVELLRAEKWNQFCKLRKIDLGDTKAMQKRYYLEPTEAKLLGVSK
jgi:hypothetical protein